MQPRSSYSAQLNTLLKLYILFNEKISFTLTLWVTPNQTPSLKREVFSGTILGHPKHVLHFVPSPNAIAKAFNVM